MENKKGLSDWSKSIFAISIMAAIFRALYLANDTFIMHNVIIAEDPFTAVSAYLILGGWLGTLCTLIYNFFLGKWIDKDYPGFNFGTKKTQAFAIISGLLAAGATTFCLMGNQALDPSLVIALSNLSILYLVIYDGLRKNVSFKRIWLPSSLIILGSIFASVTKVTGGLEFTILGIVLLLVGQCGADATERLVRQKGTKLSDAITFNLWRLFWLSISGTILACSIAAARGTLDNLFNLIVNICVPALPWILLTMMFVFFFSTLFQKALKKDAASKVSLIINLSIIVGVPIALLGNSLYPGVFGKIPTDFLTWLVRVVGITMIIIGVIYIKNREDKRNKNNQSEK